MEIMPSIFTAQVMHKRQFPKVNQFTYGIYYLSLPLSQIHDDVLTSMLAINRPGFMSFYERDHGNRTGERLEDWGRDILSDYGLNDITTDIVLVSMPRVLGYVFNPVSFWLCLDAEKNLRAVLCEVHNTFGEQHSYLCAHPDRRPITGDDWLEAEKVFHVSPFLKREGKYLFRFLLKGEKFGVWIDFYDAEGKQQLLTSLVGHFTPLSRQALWHAFFSHPLVTLKAILLIHWQALKLVSKGIRYIPKPRQIKQKISSTHNLTKM